MLMGKLKSQKLKKKRKKPRNRFKDYLMRETWKLELPAKFVELAQMAVAEATATEAARNQDAKILGKKLVPSIPITMRYITRNGKENNDTRKRRTSCNG